MSIMRRTVLRSLGVLPVAGTVAASAPERPGRPIVEQPAAERPAVEQPAAEPPAGARAAGAAGASVMPPPDRTLDLYAVELPPYNGQVRLGYGFTAASATYPGPLIELTEGETVAITLHNQVSEQTLSTLRTDPELPLGVSLHVHGLRYRRESDGTVHTGSYVPPGESRTYTWHAKKPANGFPGTAGYWWYHDHAVGTMHGTAGLRAGLVGAVVVRRPADPKPELSFVTFFGDTQGINLRRYPDIDTYDPNNPRPGPTSFVAREGQRVEFVNVCIGNDMHTWHLHGHSWADTRTGLLASGQSPDTVETIDNKTIGPGDSFGFQVIAGDVSGPGDWMLHCHMQFHSDMGMATAFHVLDVNGNPATMAKPPNPESGPMDDHSGLGHSG